MRSAAMKSLLVALALPLAACGGFGEEPVRNPRAATRLTEALAGKVAGAPQRCLPRYRRNEQEIVDRGTILYRNGRDLLYRNDPPGGCGGLDRSRTLVVMPINGGDYCSGDIVRVVDQTTGTLVGSCAFGDFVPYYTPGSRADPARSMKPRGS